MKLRDRGEIEIATRIERGRREKISRKGRPPLEDPRKHQYHIRLNDEELKELKWLSQCTKMNTASIIRYSLKRYYLELRDCQEKDNN